MQRLKYFIKTTLAIFFLPIAFFIRIIKPIITIRIGRIIGSRIGHFAFEPEMYLCEKDIGFHKNCFDIFFIRESVVNEQLKKMWGRKILIAPKFLILPLYIANKMLPGYKKHVVPLCSDKHEDSLGLLNNSIAHLSFTNSEESIGIEYLGNLGINSKKKIICFYARDSAYLDSVSNSRVHAYHDYRDSDIENYIAMASTFAGFGYSMLRYGSVIKKPLLTNIPSVIDYSSKGRSDFMDIYLVTKSLFFVSTNSGPCAIATTFRIPNAFANVAPMLGSLGICRKTDMYIPKKYWLIKERRFMGVNEILKSGGGRYFETNEFAENGIELIENSPEEILNLAIEMEMRINGKWKITKEEETLQEKYNAILLSNKIKPEQMPRICTSFLQSNDYLLL